MLPEPLPIRRVLHLVAATGLGGAERVILNYCNQADRTRFAPLVCCLVNADRPDNTFTASCERQGLDLRRVALGSLPRLWRAVAELAALIRSENCAMVHSHGYLSDLLGLLAARYAGRPILSTVHGWIGAPARLSWYEALDRRILRAFDGVHCVSGALQDGLVQAGVKPEKISMLPSGMTVFPDNGRDPGDLRRELGIPQNAPVMVHAGRLSPEKGQDILLSALPQVFSETSSVLLLVGDGPLRQPLENQARDLGIRSRVIFAGHRDDMGDIYRLADLFVLPSLTEGTPMVLLEAMSFGRPVVATEVGGVPACVTDCREGLLVPPGSPKDLAEALWLLLTDPVLASSLGSAAQSKVRREYAPGAWSRNVEAIYESLLEH